MKFVSLFSGIGGFDLGLERVGMECVAQVEFDPKCQAVLDRHWPNVERFDDVTDVKGSDLGEFDLICGGYPCQDLSVAGLRAGLAGERSGLFREFMRIVAETTPQWVLIENVPGLLSSNRGRDMGTNVTTLAELGYGWAYRVLDAQNFGVAQRRRRVFIVGCLGDTRRAAEVLFDGESGLGNLAPRRAAKQDVAYTVGRSSKADRGESANLVTETHGVLDGAGEPEDNPSFTLTASSHKGVAEDGTGKGCPIVVTSGSNPVVDEDRSGPVKNDGAGQTTEEEFVMAFAQNQRDEVRDLGDASGALAAQPGMKQQTFVAVEEPITVSGASDPITTEDGTAQPVTARNGDPGIVAVGITNDPTVKVNDEHVGALRTNGPSGSRMMTAYDPEAVEAHQEAHSGSESDPAYVPEVAATLSTANGKRDGGRRQEDDVNLVAGFSGGQGAKAGGIGYEEELSPTLKATSSGSNQVPSVVAAMLVRRLTPKECERLQGFPDGWTDGQSDTARYKQLGNAVCVPVATWIGKRMMEVDRESWDGSDN